MEFKVGDIVRVIRDTKSISNHKINAGSIWYVRAINHSRDEYDIRINGSVHGYGIWVNSADLEICEIKEKKDMHTEFNMHSIVECIETHEVPQLGGVEKILKGETFEITNVDPGDELDIFVSGINNHKNWWTNSKYFKDLEEKKDMDTKFEVGSYVTAKKTFCYDGEKIVQGQRYEVYKVTDYRIQIDLGPRYWWVPKDKMTPISSSGSEYAGTEVMLKIKDVIYSNPATIVFWNDGSKTVVRCGKGETFDPEKGLAMAISKRVLGSNYAWHGRFNK